ncbi:MAG TPA: hypothetical protein VGH92_07155 [Gaiellaceae bacterium]|jgi:hypothetical protein
MAVVVAVALAAVDLVVKAVVPADAAFAHHRTPAWMGLSVGILVVVLLSTRLPSRLFALGAGVFVSGILGNLSSAALHHGLIPNPFVAGNVAFNLADTFVLGGALLVGIAAMRLALRHRELLPTHTIPVRIARYAIARMSR